MRRYALACAVTLSLLAAPAAAQVTSTTDLTAGQPPAAPPTPLSAGVGNGFGGLIGDIGAGRSLAVAIDSDLRGNLSLTTSGGGGCFNPAQDVAVMYIDTRPGGISDTTVLTDASDLYRSAVSANAPGGASELTFPAGFEPDFAIAFQIAPLGSLPALYDLTAGASPMFVRNPDILVLPSDTGGVCSPAAVEITLADLGLTPGDSFDYVITLLNGTNGFRSNELHGVATAPASNIGQVPFAFAAGDFNRYRSVGGALLINEVDADQSGTDGEEYIELHGTPGLDLSGTSVVLFNGSGDTSYTMPTFSAALSLDGQVIPSDGFFVIGSSAVANVDLVIGNTDPASATTNILQNGPDAVSLFFAPDVSFPGGTPVAALPERLWDAVVYDTSDPDATGLLAALTPGQGQINETGTGTTSIGRCGDGAGNPRETTTYLTSSPTPGAPNDCCGDGTTQAGEACDDGAMNGATACGCQVDCQFEPVGSLCGGAPTGACDVQDECDGAGACAPLVEASGVECRAAAGECDVAETCDGASAACPSDAFAASGTTCGGAPSGACDAQDTCDGTGGCMANVAMATVECRPSSGVCDPAERCDGLTTACPADLLAADGTACADGVACNGDEVCAAGVCATGTAVDCDDMDACTADMCAEPAGTCSNTPIAGCCTVDADCDDADPCTTDTCGAMTCTNTPIAGCMPDGGMPDGGAPVDGGPTPDDAGPMPVDAGPTPDDAGPTPDDGGVGTDAGAGFDAGVDPMDDGGCSCRAAGERRSAPGGLWLLGGLLGLALIRRRRG